MTTPSTADDILALEARRTRAMVEADVITLDALLRDDCRYVHSNGLIDSKQTYLEKLRSGASRYLRVDASEHQVLLLGATSVATSLLNFDVVSGGGAARTLRVHAVAIWQCTEDKTQLAFFQATLAAPVPHSQSNPGAQNER